MKKILILVGILGLMLTFNGIAWAADITFAWDANIETDLAGYKLYQSATSGDYTGSIPTDIPLAALIDRNNPEYTKSGIADGIWYWVLTAYDTSGNESGYSNEVTATIDTTPPAPPKHFLIKVIIAFISWLMKFFA